MRTLQTMMVAAALAVVPCSCKKQGDAGTAQELPPGESGASAASTAGTASVASETSHGFPVRPGMTRACGEVVMGADGSEILWDLFATTDDPAEVAAFYERELGTGGLERADGEWTWRLPAGQEVPDRVLSVGPAGAPHPSCPGLPADAKAIANFSEMHLRQ